MTTFHFTIPVKYDTRDAYGFAGKHPLGECKATIDVRGKSDG